MTPHFPNETPSYRTARDRLLAAELDLRRRMESVAEMRRALPRGAALPEDYIFQGRRADGTIGPVRLSEMFSPGSRSLALYSMMFPRHSHDTRPSPATGSAAMLPLLEGPCPSCTALLDQLDGAALHLAPRMDFVVVARAPLDRLLAFAEDRGWRHLRLYSTAGNAYNRDFLGETPEGESQPMLNVFEREGGEIRHFWGTELLYAPMDPGQEMRHLGTIEPLWTMLDFTRQGRGEMDEMFDYPCCG